MDLLDTEKPSLAENSSASNELPHVRLGTKASTLENLAPLVRMCTIGQQFTFTVDQWQRERDSLISTLQTMFCSTKVIIRSSTFSEDTLSKSNAGHFDSIGDVSSNNKQALIDAIEKVIDSYQEKNLSDHSQVLVQEYVSNVSCAGVILTCSLDTGSPYYHINMDDQTSSTHWVTSGSGSHLRTFIIARDFTHQLSHLPRELISIIKAAQELEGILCFEKLDIEFAIDKQGEVHVFQVRPITVDHSAYQISASAVHEGITESASRFESLQSPSPFIVGEKTYFGNMPDWNPAEIIGARPNPLALSLYRYLITDDTWATQRAQSGYRDVRPQPLLIAFCGQPYVDMRASLNSFIPAKINPDIAKKIIHAYLTILNNHPQLHDKIEFDVALTCWTPAFEKEATERLLPQGITSEEVAVLGDALLEITRTIIFDFNKNTSSVSSMRERLIKIKHNRLPPLRKALSLLDDCKRFGTLAFAHAARAAFVSTHFLRSAQHTGIISKAEHTSFLQKIQTIAAKFEDDCRSIQSERQYHSLIERYGHLRPGTYNITTDAYWKTPNLYFQTQKSQSKEEEEINCFSFESHQKLDKAIEPLHLSLSSHAFIEFLRTSIQAREFIKFEFTKNVSLALDMIASLGSEIGYSKDDMSMLEHQDLVNLDNGSLSVNEIKHLIEKRRKNFMLTKMVTLPSILFQANDFYCFERMLSEPNFVTQKVTQAQCVYFSDGSVSESLEGKIIIISHADPGFDWLFNHKIGGLITKYGGANSHMAIRAAEMNLPAAIGVGEKLYDKLIYAHQLHLDCANKTIRIIH